MRINLVTLRNKNIVRKNMFINRAENILNISRHDVVKKFTSSRSETVNFYNKLLEKYNYNNFALKDSAKENINYITDIVKKVKKPTELHFNILEKCDNLPIYLDLITLSKNKKNNLKLINNLLSDNYKKNKNINYDLCKDILNSKYLDKYANKYKKYRSYLMLNKDDKNAIKDLDKMVETKTYDKKIYDNLLEKKLAMKLFILKENNVFTEKEFLDYYTKTRSSLYKRLEHYVISSNREYVNDENAKLLLNIYKSTNKKNIDLRLGLLRGLNFSAKNNEEFTSKMRDFDKLLTIIDSNKHLQNFIKKGLPLDLTDINLLLNISSQCQPEKLNIFYANVAKIIGSNRKENIIHEINSHSTDLNYINSPIKENLRYRKKTFYDVLDKVVNAYNIIRYRIFYSKNNSLKNIQKENLIEKVNDIKIENGSNNLIEQSQGIIQDKIVLEDNKIAQDGIKTSISDKKIILKNNIVDFITKKLGGKTLKEQREEYVKNATKMRFDMLPEIFASITDTRKIDRNIGKLKSLSANKDALNLYLKINGNNKKLVNYLLKKRNVDGTRMFEVKEIINIIDKAETKIAKDKQSNPMYKAQDARKYYNHLYESKIQQYGKLKKIKNNK